MTLLVLGNNQSAAFRRHYEGLGERARSPVAYASYRDLVFDNVEVVNTRSGAHLSDYTGIVLANESKTPDLAAAVCLVADRGLIPIVNAAFPTPSSKVSMYVRLGLGRLDIPGTLSGSAAALLRYGLPEREEGVLKRAHAQRGRDNFKCSTADAVGILRKADPESLWCWQEFVPHRYVYTVGFFFYSPAYIIRRSTRLHRRNALKAHFWKPPGGENARWLTLGNERYRAIVELARSASLACARSGQCSVDIVRERETDRLVVIEVNNNPQFASIETFAEQRKTAWVNALAKWEGRE